MLELDCINSALLDEFLEKEDLKELIWIQDIKHKRYHRASETLWDLAQNERGIKKQSVSEVILILNYDYF